MSIEWKEYTPEGEFYDELFSSAGNPASPPNVLLTI